MSTKKIFVLLVLLNYKNAERDYLNATAAGGHM